MSIPLRIIDGWPSAEERHTEGMMWRDERYDDPDRECWWVVLPHTHPDVGTPGHPSWLTWHTTERASDPPHERWTVTGTPPRITVTPSIDVLRFVKQGEQFVRDGSYWHGFITDGELVG